MGGFLSHLKPEANSSIHTASCGPVRGNIYRHDDKIVDGFLGIPFANPPDRFQKATMANVWTEPRDCTRYGPGCPQSGPFHNMKDQLGLQFDEANCLTLNIFSPRWKKPEEFPNGFPVMVNIFGGGFEMGTSAAYDDYSISGTLPLKDIVVVTVNYRVGVFGFLTIGKETCPGNLGLWDQTLALQWIQKHIVSFGGDPNNVTVFGCSAGGVCADLLTLSRHSRDLFHKCIAMSGNAHCNMAMRSNERQSKIFEEFAVAKGYSGTTAESLLNWYEAQPIDVLTTIGTFEFSISGFMACSPNLDGDFFEKSIKELREEAPKKSFLVGGTEYEGLIMAVPDPVYSRIGTSIEASARKLFGSDVVDNPEEAVRALSEQYMTGIKETDVAAVRKRFIEFLGDAVFNHGILKTAQECSKNGNDVYLYSFDYCNPDGYGPLGGHLDFKASSHGNDFRYVMGDSGFERFQPTEEEKEVMEMMGTLYSNFAKHGDPNSAEASWEPFVAEDSIRYFKIDHPKSEMKDNFQNGRLNTVETFHQKY